MKRIPIRSGSDSARFSDLPVVTDPDPRSRNPKMGELEIAAESFERRRRKATENFVSQESKASSSREASFVGDL